MGLSMSVSFGGVAGKRHNVRSEFREGLANVSKNRTPMNRVLVDESLEDAYRDLFGDAVSEHNAKVSEKHPERVYGPGTAKGTYLDAMKASKREKASYELVAQIGNRETNPATDPACRALSSAIYERFLEKFQQRFPHLRVVTAAIHVDEATPHLHLEYVPWTDEASKRGLSVRNSQRGAYKQDGFASNEEAAKAMFELLEEAALEHGIERVEMGCTRARVPVDVFKQRIAQGAEYEYRNDPAVLGLIREQQEIIEQQQELLGRATEAPAGLFSHFSLETTLAEIREQIEKSELAQRIRDLGEKVRAIPSTWFDFIINPVTETLVQARENFRERMRSAPSAPKQPQTLDSILAGAHQSRLAAEGRTADLREEIAEINAMNAEYSDIEYSGPDL